MPTITIDDEVFAFLQKNAKPFVDSPNSTMRRLFGIQGNGETHESQAADLDPLDSLYDEPMVGRHRKAPKADLKALIQAGLLQNREKLHLVDYQGKRVKAYEALVAGARLEFQGEHYTMSNLAQQLLKKVGFKSDNVRGPKFWVTAKNVSIENLWRQFLEKRAKK
jgi:hypothetical protein